jgi:Protein of unknown function (DUF1439)
MKFLIVLIVAAGLAFAAWWGYGRLQQDIHYDLTAADLQTKVAAKFPLKKCMFACMEFYDPKIDLVANTDRVQIATPMRASLGPIELPGKVTFSARLKYDAASASVFLADIAIPDAELAGVPKEMTDLVRQHGPVIASAALSQTPIFKLSDAGKIGDIAKRGLTGIDVVDGKVRLTFRLLQ